MPPEHEYEFDGGEELIYVSAKQVRETMKVGAQVFMMLALLKAKGKGVVCDLPAMCEFLRVFLEDINDSPLEQDIDFTIVLVPGTSPVSMDLYEMFASKLSEMKKQMEELLKKRFV